MEPSDYLLAIDNSGNAPVDNNQELNSTCKAYTVCGDIPGSESLIAQLSEKIPGLELLNENDVLEVNSSFPSFDTSNTPGLG